MNYDRFTSNAALGKPQAVLSEEELAARNAIKTGDAIELAVRDSSGGLSFIKNIHWNFISINIIETKIYIKVYTETKEIRRSISSKSMSSRVGTITEADKRKKRGMVLPFVPLSLTFDEIRYSVDMPQVTYTPRHNHL